MKKLRLLAAGLALALVAALPGCAGAAPDSTSLAVDEEVLTVCIESDMYDNLEDLGKLFHKLHPEVLVLFEQLPSINFEPTPQQLEEREAALTRVSAQVMAGKGPDLFLFRDELYSFAQAMGSRALFPDLHKSMAAGVFADWNAIIDESGQPLPQDYLTPLLDAGQMDGSQYLLPLSCDVYALLADAGLWAQELPAMAEAAGFTALMDLARARGGRLDLSPKGGALELAGAFLLSAGVPAVDYGTGEVLLTPEALAPQLTAMAEAAAVDEENRRREGYDSADFYQLNNQGLTVGSLGDRLMTVAALACSGSEPRDTRAVPIPMADGGVAAYMRHWAGVRANSPQKQNAWAFVQLLLGEELQSGGQIQRGGRFYGSPSTFWDALPVRAGCWRAKLWTGTLVSFNGVSLKDPSPEMLDSAAAIAKRVTRGAAYGRQMQKASAALMTALSDAPPYDLAGALRAETASWGTYLDE